MAGPPRSILYTVEVASTLDLGRLACALERVPLPIIYLELDRDLLGVHLHEANSVPLLYYAEASQVGHFIAYRNLDGREEVKAVERMDNPTYLYAPVIFAAKPPPDFTVKPGRKARRRPFIPVQLRDLASLAKLGAYQLLYNEQVLPLYCFPTPSDWALGMMVPLEDSGTGYFYYVPLAHPPEEGFMKYDMHGGSSATFTSKMSEHGYLFFKIIRLKEQHPLVSLK